MSKQRIRLLQETQSAELAQGHSFDSISLEGAHSVCITADIDVSTPAAKDFDADVAAVAAALAVGDLTVTAVDAGAAGNSITIALVDPEDVSQSLDVVVTGSDIVVNLATDEAGLITSTVNDIKAAINEDAEALLLVLASGSGATTVVAAAEAPLENGADLVAGDIDVDVNTISISAHGMVTGLKGQVTTDGVLPTGISGSTDYFVIVVDENTIKLAASLAHANAGTAVNITASGSGTHTFTATALAGASIKLQKSLDGSLWFDVANSSNNITVSASFMWEISEPAYHYLKVVNAMSAGQLSIENKILVKGE